MQLAMGIDLGTSSVKVVALDWNRGIVAQSSEKYEVLSPCPGYAEQNPMDWFEATVTAIRKIDKEILNQIAAIAFTGQMHAVFPVDHQLRPMYNALLWFDSRSKPQAEAINRWLQSLKDDRYRTVSSDPTLPLAKIRWLQENADIDWIKVRCLMGAKDWLRCKFGGSLLTDVSEASGTQLLNETARNWDSILLRAAGISIEQLPTVTSSTNLDGTLSDSLAKQTGLPKGCPLIVGGGDFPVTMSLFHLEPIDIVINIGTSGQVASQVTASSRRNCGGLNYFSQAISEEWLQVVPLLSVGMCISWWENILNVSSNGKTHYMDMFSSDSSGPENEILSSDASARLLFLPQISGERSWIDDPLSSGSFLGLRKDHNARDLSLAIVQGLAMSIREAYQSLTSHSIMQEHRFYLTGSHKFTSMLAVEISSALGQPLFIRTFAEPTAQGAGLLAFLGAKIVASQGVLPSQWTKEEQIVPNLLKQRYYEDTYPLYLKARKVVSSL